MVPKICFVLFAVAFMAFQEAYGEESRSIGDSINGLIGTLNDIISGTVAKLTELSDELFRITQKTMEDLSNSLRQIVFGASGVIDNLVREATEKGMNVADCTVKNEILNKLSDAAVENAQKCVSGILNDTTNVVNAAVTAVEKFRDVIRDITNQSQTCGINPFCLSQSLSKTTQILVSITSDVSKLISETTENILNAQTGVGKCVTNIYNQAVSNASKITSEVVTCLTNKIVKNNQIKN